MNTLENLHLDEIKFKIELKYQNTKPFINFKNNLTNV